MGAMEPTHTDTHSIRNEEEEEHFSKGRKDDFPMIGLLQGEEKTKEGGGRRLGWVVNSKLNRASGRDCSASTSTD